MLSLRWLRRRPSFAPLALLVAALVLSASVAAAAPATVTAAEAPARSAPSAAAPVVHTFRAGEKVSAEEQAHGGWRRVHTPDGQVAFVRDEALWLDGAPAPTAPGVAPPPFATVPAKVKVFELPARSAPAEPAPVVTTFSEGAVVAVSTDETNGFRCVVLPDGRTAFVASASLTLLTAPATGIVQPLAPAPAPAAPKPTIYVKDLSHFVELTQGDDVVHPMAQSYRNRTYAWTAVAVAGALVGAALMTYAFTAGQTKSCTDDYCSDDPSIPWAMTGLGIAVGVPLVSWLLAPGRNDLLDVINTWNARHPDGQFTIESRGRSWH
jgi:hypothetical protein